MPAALLLDPRALFEASQAPRVQNRVRGQSRRDPECREDPVQHVGLHRVRPAAFEPREHGARHLGGMRELGLRPALRKPFLQDHLALHLVGLNGVKPDDLRRQAQ